MKNDIKRLVAYYVKKFETRNPFEIAKGLNVEVQIGAIGSKYGCYVFLKNHRCIFLSENLSADDKQLVMAHELAHAILHKKEDCYFMRNKTLFLNSKFERQANKFAIELLISDKDLLEYKEYNIEQLSNILGFSEELLELRLK